MGVWIKLFVAFVFVLVIFAVVDFFIAESLKRECWISDKVALSYKMTDIVEFAKLNAQQALKFSVSKAVDELNIDPGELKMCTGSNTFDCSFSDEYACEAEPCCKWDGSKCLNKDCKEIEESEGCDKCGCSDASSLRQQFVDRVKELFDPSMLDRADIEVKVDIDTVSLGLDSSYSRVDALISIKVDALDRWVNTTVSLQQSF